MTGTDMKISNKWRGQRQLKRENINYITKLSRMKSSNKLRGKIASLKSSNRMRNPGQRRNKYFKAIC
eukprot:6484259-Heterocapsa_arctica.AAC.1